jgi:uncharacterized protein DUF4214
MMSPKPSDNVPTSANSALTLKALLELPDKDFVVAAYHAMLGRAPDPGGLENYVSQVRSGIDKAQILAELAQSPEGRTKFRDIPGLNETIAEYQGAPSLLGRIYRRLLGARIRSTERSLRVIDNRLCVAERSLAKQAEELADLRALALRMLAYSGSTGPIIEWPEDDGTAQGNSLFQVSPQVARIFLEIKAAIAMKQKNSQ